MIRRGDSRVWLLETGMDRIRSKSRWSLDDYQVPAFRKDRFNRRSIRTEAFHITSQRMLQL